MTLLESSNCRAFAYNSFTALLLLFAGFFLLNIKYILSVNGNRQLPADAGPKMFCLAKIQNMETQPGVMAYLPKLKIFNL